MKELNIQLSGGPGFEPGEEIVGTVEWSSEKQPTAVELRLFWFTRGKGTEDAGLINTVRFEHPLPGESRSFRFQLPQSPYSCSGRLLSLVWALELVSLPSKQVFRREFEMGPGKQEVKLGSVAPSTPAQRWLSVKTS